MRVTLTTALVSRAKPGKARRYLWDAKVAGLGLVVHPTGRRTWVFQGQATERRRVTLAAADLEEARKLALSIATGLMVAASAPGRPIGPVQVLTLGRLLERWVVSLETRENPPVTLEKIKRCLANHVMPRLGGRPFEDLTRPDVLALRDALANSGRRGMANQVSAYLRTAFRWAEDSRLIPEAPRWRVSRFTLRRRAHALTDEQWSRMVALLRDPDAGLHSIGRLAVLALVLSGCRKGEIAGLRWDDVTETTIRLDRHKTSTKTGPKVIEVHPALWAVFVEAKATAGKAATEQPTERLRAALLASPYVFPRLSRNGIGEPISAVLGRTWADVRMRAELPETMTIHGLRGAFITQAQRLGLPLATVAAMVGHENPLTTLRHYSAPTRTEVKEGAGRVAQWIVGRG